MAGAKGALKDTQATDSIGWIQFQQLQWPTCDSTAQQQTNGTDSGYQRDESSGTGSTNPLRDTSTKSGSGGRREVHSTNSRNEATIIKLRIPECVKASVDLIVDNGSSIWLEFQILKKRIK